MKFAFKVFVYVVMINLYMNTMRESKKTESKQSALVTGGGTQIVGNESLEKRAKRKVISRSLVLNEIDIARAKGDKDKMKAYWNRWHYQNRMLENEGVLFGKYCKNRFCRVCTANRKADIINRQHPTITQWQDIQFVILTAKAQPPKHLNTWIKLTLKAVRRKFKKENN